MEQYQVTADGQTPLVVSAAAGHVVLQALSGGQALQSPANQVSFVLTYLLDNSPTS